MRHVTALAVLFVAVGSLCAMVRPAQAAEPSKDPSKKTYAIIVANNGSVDEGVEPLRYADDDGARFHELFTSVVDEAYLLTTLDRESQGIFTSLAQRTQAPSAANLRARVKAVGEKIARDRDAGVESEVYLVFTGHGNVEEGGEGYLSLTDGKLRRSDLYRDVISPLGADYTHLIIDACHAYFMVRSRGGGDDWKDDRSGESLDEAFEAYLEGDTNRAAAMRTVGVLLSTSGAAEVHEWSKFRAGVFSHELRSGLLGAADADGDGAVTYRELEAYLVAANVAVTNVRARIKVFAEPPAQDRNRPLMRLSDFRDATRLVVPRGVGGRYHVEDARGLRYADMHVDPSAETALMLLGNPVSGSSYYLRTTDSQAEVPSTGTLIASTSLNFLPLRDQPRGSVEEAFRTSLFATPFGPAFVQGYTAGREALETEGSMQTVAPSVEPERAGLDLWLDYAASTPTLGVGGVQHNISAALAFALRETLGLGPYLSYGVASTDVGTFHRVSGGVQLDRVIAANQWMFGPRLRLGHQALFFDAGDAVAADTLGLRGEAAILVARTLWSDVSVGLIAGGSIDVVTQSGSEATTERVMLNPFAGIGARF